MHAVHVALQEGFAHDDIAVTIDGAQIYRATDVSTRQQIGLAASFDVGARPGMHSLEVKILNRSALQRVQPLSVSGETWLGISLKPDNRLDIRVSSTPFGYL
jgi:hypothetical protein